MSEVKENETIIEQETENTPVVDEKTRRRANSYFFTKLGFYVFFLVIGLLLIGMFLYNLQSEAGLKNQRENSTQALSEAAAIIEKNAENAVTLTQVYHEGNRMILEDIRTALSGGLFSSLAGTEDYVHAMVFTELRKAAGTDCLFLLSSDGKIVMSEDVSQVGLNPAATNLMTQENENSLLKGTSDNNPVLVRNQFGTYYFYSGSYRFEDEQYMIVIGDDASILDDEISSLNDVSTVLSRAALINNGFLFAVDRKDHLFLYYKNGNTMLTGQDAVDAGLSVKSLADGFTGKVTINGEDYVTMTKTVGKNIVLFAAARNADVLENDIYVLIWSLLGFCIIMVLCLSYAVIVRNDFVRHAVTTDRVVLREYSRNPLYFDKSIFKKVIPLMLSGTLVMCAVSYYTQTLLEITEGIEKSGTALQEVIGRYDESQETRMVIQEYYNERFLSAARMLSFIIEAEPDILNEASNHYHRVYDAKGNRQYLLDDEGNMLKSVSASKKLQELCDANDIDAVYVFDKAGRTIATSTPNWYFIVSHDETAQSYPFLQVLDGRRDSYVQEMMTSDLGEESQFLGVAVNYYTKKDEDGETVYVSRYEYEKALNEGGGETDGITRHRSMIQIELDENLAEKLLGSTDAGSVLSTSMLSGGNIVMFDTSDDHICLYSPNPASIGRTAADLGVSEKAFSGADYYGFSRVNGETYFQYYRYLDGYYIATAIPKSSMYLSRNLITVITCAVCLLLVLILTLTVTVTSKEEEELFMAMSEDQAAKGWNSAIFSIALPSGRSVSTTQAAARWDNRYLRWGDRSPEQKLGLIIGLICVMLILYFSITASGVGTSLGSRSIIRYILSGDWDRSPKIFALSACVIALMGTYIIIILFRIPVNAFTSMLGTRGETIGHLLLSVLKYGGTIGALFYCLYLVGVDSGNLLASAGVLSLVIGLGAQSLIQDILAGIFIVFEGEFRVGDIVTISGFRGWVMDIGLRTTKIMGYDGNVKIFNNSDISGVLNMTKEASLAVARIDIEYGQDIDYVEAVMNRELPKLKEKNDKILSGPAFRGVSALGSSGVTVLVVADCYEKDIKVVERFLNREILQIFYDNDINVPFPNVTVSQLDTSSRKTMADFKDDEAETEEAAE